MIVSEAVDRFLTACRATGLSGRTVEWYAMILRAALAETWAADVAAGVTVTGLRAFLAELRERRSVTRPARVLSAATVGGYVRGLRRFLRWLAEEGVLPVALASQLKVPRPAVRAPRGIGLADVRAMLAVADVRERALVMFLLDTGCRAGEVCGLRIGQLDLAGLTACVVGKGSRERRVFLVAATVAAVRAWLLVRPPGRAGEFVFCGQRGPLTPSGLYLICKRLAARAGVAGRWNPHAFRHAYAREHLLNGGDLASLSDLLGHADLQTTQVYATFAEAELARQHARCSPAGRLSE